MWIPHNQSATMAIPDGDVSNVYEKIVSSPDRVCGDRAARQIGMVPVGWLFYTPHLTSDTTPSYSPDSRHSPDSPFGGSSASEASRPASPVPLSGQEIVTTAMFELTVSSPSNESMSPPSALPRPHLNQKSAFSRHSNDLSHLPSDGRERGKRAKQDSLESADGSQGNEGGDSISMAVARHSSLSPRVTQVSVADEPNESGGMGTTTPHPTKGTPQRGVVVATTVISSAVKGASTSRRWDVGLEAFQLSEPFIDLCRRKQVKPISAQPSFLPQQVNQIIRAPSTTVIRPPSTAHSTKPFQPSRAHRHGDERGMTGEDAFDSLIRLRRSVGSFGRSSMGLAPAAVTTPVPIRSHTSSSTYL
eukprot:GHVN01062599.1.p1 GENE.GHVN01062599.1~~GHVN01062599.1.p1  ORF type:complete len:360 (-),score=77.77 GHVN01062599.1:59-1138(-)